MIYDIFPQNSYCGNGQSINFDFDFYIENPNQLNVFYYNSDGAKTKLVYNVDYSIAEFKKQDGSYITFPIAGSNYSVLSENERIVLELTLPISQEIEYNNSSSLNADTLEYSFDYLTRLVQILSKRIDYCIETSDYTSQDVSGLVQNIINCASKAQEAYDDILEYGMTPATTTEKGVVRIGNGIEVDNDGTISVDSLPNQTDNEGKFLTTDGTNASWTDSIATDLNGKADVDLSNINASQSAKNEIISWGMPDYSAGIALTWGTPYTAPKAGIVYFSRNTYSDDNVYFKVNNTANLYFGGNYAGRDPVTILLDKGDVLTTGGGNNDAKNYMNFYPMKGAN